MRKYLHQITIAFILLGLLVGYLYADYGFNPCDIWNRYYFIWDKGKDIGLVLCVMFPVREFKAAWLSILAFFIVREIWEVFAIKDYKESSSISIIFTLFLCEIVVICFLAIYPIIKKRWQQLK